MAAGRPKPIVPRPPEVTNWRGRQALVELGGPHLMLADIGDDNRLMIGNGPDPFDDILAVQNAVMGVMQGEILPSTAPIATIPFRVTGRAWTTFEQLGQDGFDVSDNRHIGSRALCRSLRGRHVDMHDLGMRDPLVWPCPVTRSSKRAPMATNKSHSDTA